MRRFFTLLFFLTSWQLLLYSCYQETNLLVEANFTMEVAEDNLTAPVMVQIENFTSGADFYKWSFEGGEPSSSNEKNPPAITYSQPGNYSIKLEAWNNTERGEKEQHIEIYPSVKMDFDMEVLVNDHAPATVRFTNNSIGATIFKWSFEGGVPAKSDLEHPGEVVFAEPGIHQISLEGNNGTETFSIKKTIELKGLLTVGFDIVPADEDDDMEAPLTAQLTSTSTNAIHYQWASSGGDIDHPESANTTIHFDRAGTYTVRLVVDNQKQTLSLEKEINVKENSNLYILKDVKFGVKSAARSLGSFYSLGLRSMITQDKVTAQNGPSIDLVFFGINDTFSKCYFLSPDRAASVGYYEIPGAQQTYFINTLESTSVTFTPTSFDQMVDDSPLRTLDIRGNSSVSDWFVADVFPRIVLFETAGGKKGAIKIKGFVADTDGAYILTDIKVQKTAIN